MIFIQKIFYIFISLYFIIILLYFLYNKDIFYSSFKLIIKLWFEKLVPSISISYIVSIFLINYPSISYLLYPIFKSIFNFENRKACSLFLVSVIVGNPTSTKLINTAVEKKEITENEGNRLLTFSCFISTPFLYAMFDFYTFIFILAIELITSLIISLISSNKIKISKSISQTNYNNTILSTYFEIVNFLPSLLLSILASMLICNTISIFISNPFVKSLFEITNGLNILTNLKQTIYSCFFIHILIFSHGLAVILQVYWIIKKSSLSFVTFIKYRLIAVIISLINLSIIYLFILFF